MDKKTTDIKTINIRSSIFAQIRAHKYFKRMENISQLGLLRKTHGARHTRAEHCVGTYDLTYEALVNIVAIQPELVKFLNCSVGKLTIAECTLVGAICHDIGHFPFSHFFDAFPGLISDEKLNDHEDRAIHIIRNMDLDFNENDYNFINGIIQGKLPAMPGSRMVAYPEWIFEIVANHNSEIDTDKMDYIKRDWKIRTDDLKLGFDAHELLRSIYIGTEGHIMYKNSTQIVELAKARHMMHRDVYHMDSTILLESLLALQLKSHTFAEWLEISEDSFDFKTILKLHENFIIDSTAKSKFEALSALENAVKQEGGKTDYVRAQRTSATRKFSGGTKDDKVFQKMVACIAKSWND